MQLLAIKFYICYNDGKLIKINKSKTNSTSPMLHSSIRLADVRRLLRSAGELELSLHAIQRLKWFMYALEHDGNVSLVSRHFGISRSTFLRWAERFDAADPRTLPIVDSLILPVLLPLRDFACGPVISLFWRFSS